MAFIKRLIPSKQTFTVLVKWKMQIRCIATQNIDSVKIGKVINNENELVRIKWSNNEISDYPHIFLRDNCQCSECFHPVSKQRLLDTVKSVEFNIKPKSIEHNQSNDNVIITWPDDHISTFSTKWFQERKFPKSVDDIEPTTLYGIKATPWSSKELNNILPFIGYDDLMSNDQVLLKHIENLVTYGLSILKDAPQKPGLFPAISNRMSMGFLSATHYGDTFTVKSKAQPNNLAYTTGYLPLHVDLPFLLYQPGIQLLHCIDQSDGEGSGVNHLADGFKAAEQLKEHSPEHFEILSQVKFKFNDVGEDVFGRFNMEFERPIINLDFFGNVQSISYNNHVRSAFINAPVEDVIKSYKAYYALTNILYDEDIILKYKMSPGDILVFNNQRVLHGRTPYDITTTNRWLEGCYLDWDSVLSKYRVVRSQIENNESL